MPEFYGGVCGCATLNSFIIIILHYFINGTGRLLLLLPIFCIQFKMLFSFSNGFREEKNYIQQQKLNKKFYDNHYTSSLFAKKKWTVKPKFDHTKEDQETKIFFSQIFDMEF